MDGNKNCHHSCLALGHAQVKKEQRFLCYFCVIHRKHFWCDLSKCYLSCLYLSDHCSVKCSLTNPAPCTTIKEMCFRKWKNIDLDVFKKDILESDLYSLTDDQSYHQSLSR